MPAGGSDACVHRAYCLLTRRPWLDLHFAFLRDVLTAERVARTAAAAAVMTADPDSDTEDATHTSEEWELPDAAAGRRNSAVTSSLSAPGATSASIVHASPDKRESISSESEKGSAEIRRSGRRGSRLPGPLDIVSACATAGANPSLRSAKNCIARVHIHI